MSENTKIWDSFDGISFPLIREFAQFWDALRDGRTMPARKDFDPIAAKRFLPHLFLLDVLRPEMRFRGRLVGTQIVTELGFDYTGKCLDEVIPEPYLSVLHQDLRTVAESGAPHYRVTTLAWDDRPHATYHRLYMPMSVGTDQVDIIVGIACIVDRTDDTVLKDPLSAIIDGNQTMQAKIVLQS